ncbi:hypothetical protein ACJ3XI_11275 [Litorimonas sp. RW-G-Af-16]|uniref:hypothetical protein n=1 Tax=Litorimonas sp. RW-G-Af-16 TaxID=3241168 RepID=UPI00390C9B8B
MENYNAFADLMDSFRSSSDFVKIVWLLLPILLLGVMTSLILAIRKFRRCPLISFDHPELGHVTVYQSDKTLPLLQKLGGLPVLLAPESYPATAQTEK